MYRITPIVYLLFLMLLSLNGCILFKNAPKLTKPLMVKVTGGTFTQGDVIEEENSDALPLHQQKLEDFYLARYEVTYQEFDAFARLTERELPEDNNYGRGKRAVAFVNWFDAQAYCNYFGYRLPSESEWEYAAREGGKNIAFSGTSQVDSLKNYAIYSESDLNFSFLVGSRKPNALGLYDLSGNVFEWIGSYYQFYLEPEKTKDLEQSMVRIIRGGSYHHWETVARTYWRVGVLADDKDNDIGFRCAADVKDVEKGRFFGLF